MGKLKLFVIGHFSCRWNFLTCHISRWRLCHRSPQDNQSKSWKKVWPLFFLSLITSHVVITSRAEHTTSYRGIATTFSRSYHQLKTCYLKTVNLNLGRRCGQTEIVCHWSLLMSLELAEHSKQLLTCHISRGKLCHRSPQDNQSKSCKKVWPLLCFFCHWSLLMPLAPVEKSMQLLIGAEQQLLLYHTIN